MAKGIFSKLFWLSAVIGVIISIGSIGVYLNFANPNWKLIGIEPAGLKSSISEYPAKHCHSEFTRPVCEYIADGTLWFLGLN